MLRDFNYAFLISATAAETMDQDLLTGLAKPYDVEVVNVTDSCAVIVCEATSVKSA